MLPPRCAPDTSAPAPRIDESKVHRAARGATRVALFALAIAIATTPLSGQRDTATKRPSKSENGARRRPPAPEAPRRSDARPPTGTPVAPAPASVPVAPPTIEPGPVVGTSTAAWRVVLPGDALRLVIWREPDLSGEFVVDENGVVTLPKIGAIAVGTQDAGVLRRRVVAGFQPYLTHSSIDVTVLRRVQVTGAVQSPGVYRVDPTMTLGDALALAGGVTPDGNPDRLELLRRGERVGARLRVRTQIAETQVRSGDQIYVPERRWSSRRITLVAAVLGTGVTLLAVLRR